MIALFMKPRCFRTSGQKTRVFIMFTGIIRAVCSVATTKHSPNFLQYALEFPPSFLEGLEKGASVSIDGVCQTVVSIENGKVRFDAIDETLKKTTIRNLREGMAVNIERSARFGDEIGGHILSGHIYGTVSIDSIHKYENNHIVTFACNPEWMKYLFPKGFVALNGASLTVVDVMRERGLFTVHLIPETLVRTTFGQKQQGDLINIEFDTNTQAIVDTLERMHHFKT